MLRISSFCSLIFLVLIVGCSGNNVPLRGTVTFSDDGSPVPTGMVAFTKDGQTARGDIRPDGTFVVGFERETDGLPPGLYQVTVFAENFIEEPPDSGNWRTEQLIDTKYNNASTSGMTLDVTPTTRVFDFEVDRFQGR